jgi:hypothetical protein
VWLPHTLQEQTTFCLPLPLISLANGWPCIECTQALNRCLSLARGSGGASSPGSRRGAGGGVQLQPHGGKQGGAGRRGGCGGTAHSSPTGCPPSRGLVGR